LYGERTDKIIKVICKNCLKLRYIKHFSAIDSKRDAAKFIRSNWGTKSETMKIATEIARELL